MMIINNLKFRKLNFGKLIDVSNKIDSIDTFESYCEQCYLIRNSLLIPFINLHIIDSNIIGNNEDRLNIEFSYLIFVGIKEICWIGKNELNQEVIGSKRLKIKSSKDLKNWVAVNRENQGYEIKLIFERMMIFVPFESRVGKNPWIYRKTPNFQENIESEKVINFFNLINIPKKVSRKMDSKSYFNLDFTIGTKEERKLIKKNWTK